MYVLLPNISGQTETRDVIVFCPHCNELCKRRGLARNVRRAHINIVCINRSLFICSSIPIAMLGSTLLCFGDAFLFIETIAILGDMYPDHGAEAISLYKFVMVIIYLFLYK